MMQVDAEFICRALPLISMTPMEYITKMLKRTAALDVAAVGLLIANQNNSGYSPDGWIYFLKATYLVCERLQSPARLPRSLPKQARLFIYSHT